MKILHERDSVSQAADLGQTISYCIDANYWKGTTIEQFVTKKRRQLVVV